MTRTRRRCRSLPLLLTLLSGCLLLGPPSASAQHIATSTTLSAAVTAVQTTITVASNTTFAANALAWVDQELLRVTAVSGTTISVRRGIDGTSARAHNSGAKVTVSIEAAGQVHFYRFPPDIQQTCTTGTGQASVSPWIDTTTGFVWKCNAASTWAATSKAVLVYNSDQVFTP